MANKQEIEDIVKMLDAKVSSGVGRIKVNVTEDTQGISDTHYLGRCDIQGECAPEITKHTK